MKRCIQRGTVPSDASSNGGLVGGVEVAGLVV